MTNAVAPQASEQKGSGIGLSNMRAMMEKMGGSLETVQTEEIFRVILRFPLEHVRCEEKNQENG